MSAAGKAWQEATEEQKKPFEEMQEKDKMRQAKELQELRQTGYFTNSDGVNSKDMVPKKRIVQQYQQYNGGQQMYGG